MLDEVLLELLKAAESLEPEGQQVMPSALSEKSQLMGDTAIGFFINRFEFGLTLSLQFVNIDVDALTLQILV